MGEIFGLVGGIQKYSTSDGPGIRTTVFLKGCPLRCRWCHNPELIDFQQQILFTQKKCIGCGNCVKACPQNAFEHFGTHVGRDKEKCKGCYACVDHCYSEALRLAGKKMTVQEVMRVVLQDRGYYARTGGGMTISGGELLSHPEFANALLDAAKQEGISVALDTSGHGDGDKLYKMAQKADYILYDMKSIDDETHKLATGVSNRRILQNLRRLASDEVIRSKIWMRMPLIHGINDTEEIIRDTCRFFEENHLTYVTLFPYHELGISKYASLGIPCENFTPPDGERLQQICCQLKKSGVRADVLGEKIQ